MSTVTLDATGTYYHISALNDSSASPWIQGGPRKGVENGQRAIGMVTFDGDQIISAVNGGRLLSANLILYRDPSDGTDPVDISIAYLLENNLNTDAATYDECFKNAVRPIHTQASVQGTSTSIPLPGYWLWRMKGASDNNFAGFVIYREPDEGTDTPVKFTSTVKLRLNIGTGFDTPIWARGIGQGDIISDVSKSHVRDLLEIQYYINLRAVYHGLASENTINSYIEDATYSILYSDWPTVIRLLQNRMDLILEKEQKTITWKRAAAGDLPNAEIVNQLRDFLETDISGPKETVTVTTYGRTIFDHYDSDFTVNLNTTTTWAKKGPWNGMNWEYVTVDGVKRKKYNRRFGIWIFRNALVGKTVTSLKLRVKRAEGTGSNKEIRLFPVKVSAVPTSKMSINQVMVTSTVVGRGTASVGGTVDIPLSADFINKLMSGTYYGVGVFDKDYWTNFGTSATLIING